MGKAINLSLKATVEPYIRQICNLVSWIQFFLFCSSNINKGKNNYGLFTNYVDKILAIRPPTHPCTMVFVVLDLGQELVCCNN